MLLLAGFVATKAGGPELPTTAAAGIGTYSTSNQAFAPPARPSSIDGLCASACTSFSRGFSPTRSRTPRTPISVFPCRLGFSDPTPCPHQMRSHPYLISSSRCRRPIRAGNRPARRPDPASFFFFLPARQSIAGPYNPANLTYRDPRTTRRPCLPRSRAPRLAETVVRTAIYANFISRSLGSRLVAHCARFIAHRVTCPI